MVSMSVAMSQSGSRSAQLSAINRLAGSLTVAAGVVALVALAALHLLRPDLSPASHMISEYALGAHGWAMTASFAAFSLGSAMLLVSLATRMQGWLGRVGLGALLLAAVGLALAALFPMDPASTPPEQMSLSGRMHGVAFMIGVPGQILSVLLLSLALRKEMARPALLVALAATVWVSLAAMIVALVIAAPQPGTPPTGIFGLPNRAFMGAYAFWLILAAWPAARGRAHPR